VLWWKNTTGKGFENSRGLSWAETVTVTELLLITGIFLMYLSCNVGAASGCCGRSRCLAQQGSVLNFLKTAAKSAAYFAKMQAILSGCFPRFM
jgi:hypothetical protein